MMIIGVDYHPSFQQIAFLDQETGECGERRLNHGPTTRESKREDNGHRSQRGAAAMEREAVRLLALCEADGTKVKGCAA